MSTATAVITPTSSSSVSTRHRLPRRRGLGLVELLVSLMITASLLTAVAVATSASFRVVDQTDDFSRAAQTARTTLNFVLTDCRRGQPDPNSTTETQVRVLTAENIDRTYRYVPETQQIIMINNDVIGDPGRVVARHVTSAKFYAESGGTPVATRRISVELTVTVGTNAVHLSGSASPRQNAAY